jgi:hypothetical protein
LSTTGRVRLVLTAAASYIALYGILLWQALRGQSVLAPDSLTLTTIGVWAIATAVAAGLSLLQPGQISTAAVV